MDNANKRILLAFACALLLASATTSQASAITASERIVDLNQTGADQDLQRTRSSSTGFLQVEDDDSLIAVENDITVDFGSQNSYDLNYRHDLTWIQPPAETFLNVELSIQAFGSQGNNESVAVESVRLGNLVSGTTHTLTLFTTTDPLILTSLYEDGYLYISIDKNRMGGGMGGGGMGGGGMGGGGMGGGGGGMGGGSTNSVSVYGSTATVSYEPVPEPSSMALLGAGLLAFAIRRRAR